MKQDNTHPSPQEMKIGSLAPWFGGKRTLAPRIVRELGQHRVYWEPFCGSMAVLFAKPACKMETVNDLHGDLVNLARVVQSDDLAPRLFARIARTAMHEGIFKEAVVRVRARNASRPSKPDFQAAYDYLVVSWVGMNGVAGTNHNNTNFCVRYTANGGHAATRFRSVCDSIPAWWNRLRNVTILNRDAHALIERVDDKAGTVMYVDPPYVDKGARYVHDFTWHDHLRLSELLRDKKNMRVVVSYYDHPKIRALYAGWTCVRVAASKSLVSSGMRDNSGVTRAPEILLINGPSLTRNKEP